MQFPEFITNLIQSYESAGWRPGFEGFFTQYYPWIITALVALLLVCYLPRYCFEGYTGRYFLNTRRHEAPEELRFLNFGKRPLRAVMWAVIMFAASRAAWLLALQIYLSMSGESITADNINYFINHWDTVNYTRIAEFWYGFDNHGIEDYVQEYTIAFLPGYPVLIKGLNLLVNNYVLSGVILSNAMTIGSGILLYNIVADKYNEPVARRACVFFYFSFGACVFSATHSESAMFFFTLLAVYLARKRHFVLAVIAGAYACFTRQFGIFVAVPVFYEMLRSMDRYPTGEEIIMRERSDVGAYGGRPSVIECIKRSVRLRNVWKYFLLAASVLAGYGAYLYINYAVYGNAFAFLYYQQLNWGNQIAPVWVTVRTSAESMFHYFAEGGGANSIMGIFLPQLVMALAVPAIMLCFVRRGDAGDNAYAWCYFTLTFSSTWLISGLRYTAAMYPLYIMLALLSGRKGVRYTLYVITAILFLYYNVTYSVYGFIV